MIKNFTCRNFRNIQADRLEFEKINLLIGPNNSGKTNFIKALSFMSDTLKYRNEGNLHSALLNQLARNGWVHIVNKNSQSKNIEFGWELRLEDEELRYGIAFEVGNEVENCCVTLEELNDATEGREYDQPFNFFRCHDQSIGQGKFSTALRKGRANKRIMFSLNSNDTIMTQFKNILLEHEVLYGSETVRVDIAKKLSEVQNYFEKFQIYSGASFDSSEMRSAAEPRNIDEELNKNGGNFINLFNRYKVMDLVWKKEYAERMQELIPQLKDVDVSLKYDKLILQLLYENGITYDLNDVSEGTIKGLLLNMLIFPPKGKKIPLLAIDEPESNLHPAWQKVVGNWLQVSDSYRQIFLSTHSPDFLDVFTEQFKQGRVAVFVFGNENNECTIKKISYGDIKDELGEWELGDLYRTSDPALGGWPW